MKFGAVWELCRYGVQRGGGMYFGFVAPLNAPHDRITLSSYFAACRGVLTLPAWRGSAWGSALQAIASLLQAKQMPPPSVQFYFGFGAQRSFFL